MKFYKWIDVTVLYIRYDYTLVIRAVDLNDDKIYLCEISEKTNRPYLYMQYRANKDEFWSCGKKISSIDSGKIFFFNYIKNIYAEATEKG